MMMWILRGTAAFVVGVVLAIGLPDPAPAAPAVPAVAGLPTANPELVAAYFAGLSSGRAWALAMNAPMTIGNLDGAPIAVRYAANARDAGARYAGRQILGYQPGSDGRIIEVVGDLTSATRIAVLVPGSDTTLSDFDGGLGGVQRRAPAWQARQLLAASGPGTAVVAWLGYDARRLPAAVTDLVAIGSPGMDVSRASDLHTNARVWAGSDPTDWTLRLPNIRILGAGHGTNPTAAGFGARPLRVGDAAGHDGYFVSGTDALASIASVVAGSTAGSKVTS